MSFYGITITGPKYVGKTSIEKKLIEKTSYFKKVKTITTRARRTEETSDEYTFLSEEDFAILKTEDKLLLETTYNSNLYGINKNALPANNQIPIFVIEPSTVKTLENNIKTMFGKEEKQDLLTIFIDSEDSILKQRAINRDGNETQVDFELVNKDRKYKDESIYYIRNNDLEKVTDLIITLWKFRNSGGVLHKDLIIKGLYSGLFLDNANPLQTKGASYDLQLGDEFYYGGKINRISDEEPFFKIDPYDYAIVTSHESANLPRNISARFDLSVGLFCQGIILSNGPQIDPGFRGKLFCLLFNTSNRSVVLKKQQKYATIEFNKLIFPTDQYTGKYQDEQKIINYLPSNVMQGAVSELKKELDELKNETKNLHTYFMAVIAIILATIPLMIIFKG